MTRKFVESLLQEAEACLQAPCLKEDETIAAAMRQLQAAMHDLKYLQPSSVPTSVFTGVSYVNLVSGLALWFFGFKLTAAIALLGSLNVSLWLTRSQIPNIGATTVVPLEAAEAATETLLKASKRMLHEDQYDPLHWASLVSSLNHHLLALQFAKTVVSKLGAQEHSSPPSFFIRLKPYFRWLVLPSKPVAVEESVLFSPLESPAVQCPVTESPDSGATNDVVEDQTVESAAEPDDLVGGVSEEQFGGAVNTDEYSICECLPEEETGIKYAETMQQRKPMRLADCSTKDQ